MRNHVCFHLWCEVTLALWCHSIVWSFFHLMNFVFTFLVTWLLKHVQYEYEPRKKKYLKHLILKIFCSSNFPHEYVGMFLLSKFMLVVLYQSLLFSFSLKTLQFAMFVAALVFENVLTILPSQLTSRKHLNIF